MRKFEYTVVVECETQAQADQVMVERIDVDEPYHYDADGNHYPEPDGFDYTIEFRS